MNQFSQPPSTSYGSQSSPPSDEYAVSATGYQGSLDKGVILPPCSVSISSALNVHPKLTK